jgi:hypothetical protein
MGAHVQSPCCFDRNPVVRPEIERSGTHPDDALEMLANP